MDPVVMHDLTAAYALDALDADERREYEEHLRGCEQCQEELAGLRDTAATLAYAAPAPEPSPALRGRLLDGIAAEESAKVVPLRRRLAVPALGGAAVAATAAAIALGVWAGSLSNSLDEERAAGRDTAAAVEVLADPDAVRVPLEGAAGSLLVAGDGRAALVLESLEIAPDGQTYEAWVIRDGTAVPAGLFAGGEAAVVRLSERVGPDSIVAVTVEEAGGVDQPTGDPVFSASVT